MFTTFINTKAGLFKSSIVLIVLQLKCYKHLKQKQKQKTTTCFQQIELVFNIMKQYSQLAIILLFIIVWSQKHLDW